jgi:YfiH family protein
MLLFAPNISCKHAFTTRNGGASDNEFTSLNLGGKEDNPSNILKNRSLVFQNLNLSIDNLCSLIQVHGNKVCIAEKTQQEGDALVTNQKKLALTISIADCYPILFHDSINNVIGASHAGWRGTLGKITENTISEMIKLGANINNIQVAIGQGISKNKFIVRDDVIQLFEKANFPSYCWEENKIDLEACNRFTLLQNGIYEKNIWSMNRCTYEKDFFSYRRDAGKTGRMWAIISL